MNNGVTVVSHDAFVNARPAAQNMMRVEPREIAAAPVSHVVAAEPIRSSVVGAGRPVTARPPAAVISRPVVAVRTPPAPPRPIEQRQAQAGGHLNQQVLVRPAGPAQPAQMNPGARLQQPQNQGGFRSFGQPNNNPPANSQPANSQVRVQPNAQPRVYESQGNPQPENRPENANPQQPQNRYEQPQQGFRPPQQQSRPVPQETHPLVHPAPQVQERNEQQERQQEQKFNQWQQQRPASPPPQQHQQQSRPEPPKSEPPKSEPKKH